MDFDLLCRLHEQRWGDTSEAFSEVRRPFLREFAHAALERGWLRFWFLELDGQAAAAWLGFRFGDVESYSSWGAIPNSSNCRSEQCSSRTHSARRSRTA